MEVISLVVQIALAGAALWYTLETRRLRIQNSEEIKVLLNQGRVALAPFLVPGVKRLNVQELHELISSDEDLDEAEKEKRKDFAANADVFFVVQVDNPTADKIGCQLQPYIYDPSTKSFLIPDHGKAWISPRESEHIQVTGPYVTLEKVQSSLSEHYGESAENLVKHLDAPDEAGYIALFFQDIEGTLYLSKREFALSDGETLHRTTRLVHADLKA
ncbi:hypothetical protein [Salinisphaera japonica]|uniref:hypothetical protein n=1 Tax=Salinisphaera japonica TaxID=1304270 RepID=UPI000F4B4B23|nr:hypothetical protein [Salinisphaera japonica]